MPNGDKTEVSHKEYNVAWCDERHRKIDKEFQSVWEKLKKQDSLMWGMVLTLIGNLGGVIAIFVKITLGS